MKISAFYFFYLLLHNSIFHFAWVRLHSILLLFVNNVNALHISCKVEQSDRIIKMSLCKMNNGFRTWTCLCQTFWLTHYRLLNQYYRKIAEQNVRHYFSLFILWTELNWLDFVLFSPCSILIPCRTHTNTHLCEILQDERIFWRITWCIMTWQKQFIIDLNY